MNTPAKTGLPGFVKPANYREFVSFSIEVFDALCNVGWVRLSCVGAALHSNSRVVIESFPLSAWRSLGIAPLPSKPKTKSTELETRLLALGGILPLHLSGTPTHDQLQAVVAGLAGLAVERNAWKACAAAGLPPFAYDGCWREGFILNATRGIRQGLSNIAMEPTVLAQPAIALHNANAALTAATLAADPDARKDVRPRANVEHSKLLVLRHAKRFEAQIRGQLARQRRGDGTTGEAPDDREEAAFNRVWRARRLTRARIGERRGDHGLDTRTTFNSHRFLPVRSR